MKEIIIIKTTQSEKIKNLLDQNNTDYEIVYKDAINISEEEIWRRDILLANKDEARNKEIAEWDAISDEDDWEEIKANEWE